MPQKCNLDMFTKGRTIGMLECGRSQTEVSQVLNVSQCAISKLWKRFQITGNVARRPVPGRPKVTTARQDRYLTITARRQRKISASELSSALTTATGVRVSRQTVYRRLDKVGLYARRPSVCVPLTSAQKRARLQWSLEHRQWSEQQWRNVMFSDESRFCLETDSRRTTIWRERGTRFYEKNITEKHRFAKQGVMVWAGIMLGGRTDLHIFDKGSITGKRYRDEVLEPTVRLFRGAVGHEFIFMDDNATPHRAALVDDFLESEDIQRMQWPANSPDLNPIEHVWDMLGRGIAAFCPPPSSIPELKTALLQVWETLSTELIITLIESMKNRCAACVAARGGHTPY
ncbi:dna-mediated transposase [Lasius niger]|uniref:Dna-mediated transposase n=1 Tax=Lasius niger TaxID=67767 RepID=A0A0J7JXG3_LASNI|nr:dna-mediated transposase [Lasius niger]